MFVGWLPIGTGVLIVEVVGVIDTIELPVICDEPDPTLAIMLREYGSYRIWLTPSVVTVYTESGRLDEVPPPGAAFETLTALQPSAASLLAGTVAVNCVALSSDVAIGVPSKRIEEPVEKPVPVTVISVSPAPARIVAGLMEAIAGKAL